MPEKDSDDVKLSLSFMLLPETRVPPTINDADSCKAIDATTLTYIDLLSKRSRAAVNPRPCGSLAGTARYGTTELNNTLDESLR